MRLPSIGLFSLENIIYLLGAFVKDYFYIPPKKISKLTLDTFANTVVY